MKEINLMESTEKLNQEYLQLFPAEMPILEISDKLDSMKQDEKTLTFRRTFCDELEYSISAGFIEYGTSIDLKNNVMVRIFVHNVERLPQEDSFMHMLCAFYQGKYDECLSWLDDMCKVMQEEIDNGTGPYNEATLVDLFMEPMKEAFPGFWLYVQKKLEKLCKKDGTHELCLLMDRIYSRSSDDEGIDILTDYIRKYPDIIISKEYLACIYFNTKMYNNAIAWFESIGNPESTMLFAIFPGKREALLGDAYGKIRNYREEEKHYRKALELDPKILFVANNLGYSLYKQKRYIEALNVLQGCIDEKKDMPYAANVYLRTLIALGRNKDAKAFVRKSDFKISKNLIEKVKSLPDTNQRISKKSVTEENEFSDDSDETQIDTTAIAVKGSQFSTEKLLEDELTQRIENGIPVFGMNLKMYKRPGEYGRQYIIPVGRLDLFCEDNLGNLYVIELKKDSGYDDAYKQTVDYLDWFAASPKFRDKKIYGIICLNDPSDDLIAKVRSDKRIRLFEYKVLYKELK